MSIQGRTTALEYYLYKIRMTYGHSETADKYYTFTIPKTSQSLSTPIAEASRSISSHRIAPR
jgi:hypothetical protein